MESRKYAKKAVAKRQRRNQEDKSDAFKKTAKQLYSCAISEEPSSSTSSDDLEFVFSPRNYRKSSIPKLQKFNYKQKTDSIISTNLPIQPNQNPEETKIPQYSRTELQMKKGSSNTSHSTINQFSATNLRKTVTNRNENCSTSYQTPKRRSKIVGFEPIELKSRTNKLVNFEAPLNKQDKTSVFITDHFKKGPEPATRKQISPFYREPSPLLRQFEKLLNDEIAENAEKRVSIDAIRELVARIDNLEYSMRKSQADIEMELDHLKNESITKQARDADLEVIQASADHFAEGRSEACLIQNTEVQRLQPEDYQFCILYGITTFLGISLILMTYFWLNEFLGGFSFTVSKLEQNFHALLMVIGLVFLNSQAMLIFRTAKYITRDKRMISKLGIVHAALQVISLILGSLSMKAAYDSLSYGEPPTPHMFTLHAWVGLGTFILFVLELILGFIFLLPNVPSRVFTALLPLHETIGITCFLLIIASCLLGYTEKVMWVLGYQYSMGTSSGNLVNSIGFLMVVFAGLVFYLLREKGESWS